MSETIEAIASFEGRMAQVCGPAGSGKTEALIRRLATLLEAQTDPASILVVTTSAEGARAFRRRAAKVCGDALARKLDEVRITSAERICFDTLSAIRAQSDQAPLRVLNNAEYNFFLEDMKTLGQPIRRLRSMLAFFYRQWANNEPQSDWKIGGEEEAVLEHLHSLLDSENALLREEIAHRCATALQSEEGLSQRHRFAYILCDDFQNLSRAAQISVCMLAEKQLIVCGNPNETIQITTHAYPHPEGFTDFAKLRNGVQVFNLNAFTAQADIAAFANALCDQGDMNPAFRFALDEAGKNDGSSAFSGVLCVKWNTPDDEVSGVAAYLCSLLNADPSLKEQDICILVPNKIWARSFKRALARKGKAATTIGAIRGIGGDPRDVEKAQALIALTKLKLIADPEDLVAWRSWCGIGNYLTNSNAWAGLMSYAKGRDLTLLEGLASLAEAEEEPFPRANVLADRYRQGREIIEKHAKKRGFALLKAAGASTLSEFEDIEREISGTESATEIVALVNQMLLDPVTPEDHRLIHIASAETLCGTTYRVVVATGLVDGLVPQRDAFEMISTDKDRERVINADRRRFYSAVSKAQEHLLLSYFSHSPLETAERAKMQVVRVYAKDGGREASVRPSVFLSEAKSACPGSTSGQMILSEVGEA